jgi:hypothetical protein
MSVCLLSGTNLGSCLSVCCLDSYRFLSVCLSVCVSAVWALIGSCLSVCLSVCCLDSDRFPVSLSVCLSVCLSAVRTMNRARTISDGQNPVTYVARLEPVCACLRTSLHVFVYEDACAPGWRLSVQVRKIQTDGQIDRHTNEGTGAAYGTSCVHLHMYARFVCMHDPLAYVCMVCMYA